MQEYRSRPVEWQKYAFVDSTRNYTRNLVDKGNGRSKLVIPFYQSGFFQLMKVQLVLVWTPGKGSPIHDHAGSHYIMKVRH